MMQLAKVPCHLSWFPSFFHILLDCRLYSMVGGKKMGGKLSGPKIRPFWKTRKVCFPKKRGREVGIFQKNNKFFKIWHDNRKKNRMWCRNPPIAKKMMLKKKLAKSSRRAHFRKVGGHFPTFWRKKIAPTFLYRPGTFTIKNAWIILPYKVSRSVCLPLSIYWYYW